MPGRLRRLALENLPDSPEASAKRSPSALDIVGNTLGLRCHRLEDGTKIIDESYSLVEEYAGQGANSAVQNEVHDIEHRVGGQVDGRKDVNQHHWYPLFRRFGGCIEFDTNNVPCQNKVTSCTVLP